MNMLYILHGELVAVSINKLRQGLQLPPNKKARE